MNVVAVLAVIEKRHAVIALGKVRELMRARLELLLIPGRVLMRRALDRTELDLERSFIRIYIYRESGAQDAVQAVPVKLGLEIDPRVFSVEPYVLYDRAAAVLALDPDACFPALEERLNAFNVSDRIIFISAEFLDLPRVLNVRVVFVNAQLVPRASGDHLAVILFVVK